MYEEGLSQEEEDEVRVAALSHFKVRFLIKQLTLEQVQALFAAQAQASSVMYQAFPQHLENICLSPNTTGPYVLRDTMPIFGCHCFVYVQDGSWSLESVDMIGMDQNKVEQYLVSVGAKSLGRWCFMVVSS